MIQERFCDSEANRPTFDQAKNKRFGEFEFEYFGSSNVVNKLKKELQIYTKISLGNFEKLVFWSFVPFFDGSF